MIRALLLDFDGTVVDSLSLIFECLDETAREHLDMSFPREVWEDHIGIPLRETFALLGERAVPESERLMATYRRKQVECSHRLQAFDQMPEVLAALRGRGTRLAIVTTKLRSVAVEHLTAIGLLDHFDVIVGFDDCAAAKPDPAPFRRAMTVLGVEPADCVAVGDTANDIVGARAAGVCAVAATWSGVSVPQLLAAQPDLIVSEPRELLALVDPLRRST